MSHPPVELHALSKTYRLGFFLSRQVRALENLDMVIEAGQVYGLLGPNGAGKSTTIKIVMNLVQPTDGTALLFGRAPTDTAARRQVGFVPENPAPYEYLTGREFVELAAHLGGVPRAEVRTRTLEVLESVGMARAADLQIRRYSKGMIQRVALAQAVVHRPPLLILDEPTSGLDPVGRRMVRDFILEERKRGTTVLFCTHIIPDVEALCDRVAVLVNGRRVREGRVADLLTGATPQVEMVIEGLSERQLRELGRTLDEVQALEARLRVRCSDAEAQQLLGQVLRAGGRVSSLEPARFTLEDLFLEALSEARQGAVGGEIL
ncbi:MAG TPA: ABC transporter ATP-binding protein [Myxococcaceae bacterium]|nr:ABC transporter ATP-binding protein [Myxococcaceae bacterium]